MVLKLRLARVATPGGSKRHHPQYNIVLAHARTARDSKPLEVLGTYNPIPQLPVGAQPGARKQKDIKLDVSRAKYWLGVGAQPSDTVWRLMSMIGLLEPKYLPTGAQTVNALKAVRFATHVSRPSKSKSPSDQDGGDLASRMAQKQKDELSSLSANIGKDRAAGEVAENTSPQDPNAA